MEGWPFLKNNVEKKTKKEKNPGKLLIKAELTRVFPFLSNLSSYFY